MININNKNDNKLEATLDVISSITSQAKYYNKT